MFTLGLTESWKNTRGDYVYGICPGVAGGTFDPAANVFHNLSVGECVVDLATAFETIQSINAGVKVLLTVSPVMLVATAESRSVLQSSIASKSILRAAADECMRSLSFVDYFPSYEIIAGPQAFGRFYTNGGRDVSQRGVELVMDVFFRSRIVLQPALDPPAPATDQSKPSKLMTIDELLQVECDELLLGKGRP